jgi:hypothetical protein
LQNALQKQLSFYSQDAAAAQAFVETGKSARDKTLDVAKHAALSAVCLTIMNLDEAMTRE